MKINLVTTNTMKFQISQAYFEALGGDYELVQCAVETPEIQHTSVEEIAMQSALWAAKQTGEPCITSDVGCFITALNGFPGPFVKYANNWLTQQDYLNLLHDKADRSAYFQDALALASPNGTAKVFSRKVYGSLATTPDQDQKRWAMDALFIPDGYTITLGKMTDEEQVKFWGDGNWPEMIRHLEEKG